MIAMKKILMSMTVAAAMIAFASCGNSNNGGQAATDSPKADEPKTCCGECPEAGCDGCTAEECAACTECTECAGCPVECTECPDSTVVECCEK